MSTDTSSLKFLITTCIRLNFEPYVIESELFTCIHDLMKTFYKGINLIGIHLLALHIATRQDLNEKQTV